MSHAPHTEPVHDPHDPSDLHYGSRILGAAVLGAIACGVCMHTMPWCAPAVMGATTHGIAVVMAACTGGAVVGYDAFRQAQTGQAPAWLRAMMITLILCGIIAILSWGASSLLHASSTSASTAHLCRHATGPAIPTHGCNPLHTTDNKIRMQCTGGV